MSELRFQFNPQQSNLLALSVDFFLSNVNDLTEVQQQLLTDLLMTFDDVLEEWEADSRLSLPQNVKDIQGNLISVDFGNK